MEYQVEIAPAAHADAEATFAWIVQDSPRAASKWYTGLFAAIDTLQFNPARCSLVPESDAFEEEIRQLLYGKRRHVFRILFTIRGQIVHVLRIWRGSRHFLQREDLAL